MTHVYANYEGDVSDWASTDDEYLAARRFANQAVQMWEFYDNTKWRELFKKHSATASDVVKTITAGTYAYTTSSDFRFPCSYVRTERSNTSTYYSVLPVEEIAPGDDNADRWVYFTGNAKDGHVLNFNSELTLATGDTLQYEYYKIATPFTASDTTTEMSNPMFIVHYILWRMYKNDGENGKALEEFQLAQQILEGMRVDNMEGIWNQSFNLPYNSEFTEGFGV
jgi:hypothetical protein